MEAPKASSGSTLVMILGGLEIALIAAVGYFLSQLVGTADTNNDLVKTVLPVTGTIGGIVLLHTGLWYLYFTYNPLSMNLYFLLATSMSIIISLTALSVAIINRV
jgi:hypothetical protein